MRGSIWNLRKGISAIFQDFIQYQLIVRENIGIGNIESINNLAKIEIAATSTGLAETIGALKKQYDTQLGNLFEFGTDLSGGQWQKLALSRALFKDADFLVLDEPTAAMDPVAETKLLSDFITLLGGKTTIFITHRLGICKSVDKIIVLKRGRIVEQGIIMIY